MTAEERLIKKILSAGSAGAKKADLRKELGEIDATLEALVSKGEVFVDKRGSAYYCFHKSHYVQSLLNTDPRFKLTYDMIKSLDETVSSSSKEVARAIETLAGNISNLARLVTERGTATAQASAAPTRAVSVSDFKVAFDAALANSASSIGWVELAKIKSDVCAKCGLSGDEFYRLVGELTGQYQDKYELSTGGGEGVMVRGLLHGFVRCI
ncbi:MAG: hypothetical protein QXJ74_04840 [Nitrososphaera sp.]|uniref:hypothetical protein n=1 Tax=Nitrososphaera sp. TaxID=1971748 RepID=UPI0017DD4F69|nr:hypothetical protein [Nitrososphaera sp.]NWG38067.1 hypothetical protein [Nitrososphaera sp.]